MQNYPHIQDLTTEEKARLTSGTNPWSIGSVPEKGLPNYTITDGPHGLRKAQDVESVEVSENVPATCFPPAAAMSSTWNPELIEQVGKAMGEECIQEGVAVILGPGVNIKRNPLGGRNFEYWSEDPYLAGHEAIGIVSGVQSQGVGTSLKHFAANNQEFDRMRVDARISQRALREIYLPAFEHIVKHAQPWTIMCSYNRINGVYSSQNRWLLTNVLRNEWGFEGIVMSDWGAVHDRVAALNAGLNLEMPPSDTDEEIVVAVCDGRIMPEQLDRMAQGMIDLVEKARPAMARNGERYDMQAHHELARRAAHESAVLLKNDQHILPLDAKQRIGFIGEFARTPRYQGAGSSLINPTKLDNALQDALNRGLNVEFAAGFNLDSEESDSALVEQAVEVARNVDVAVVFLGLPEQAESEGFDRTTLDLPYNQIELLEAIHEVNNHVVVVLANGSTVAMPWRDQTQAILETWLLGQASGSTLVDLLTGEANPSGKLAQTLIDNIALDPSTMNWPGEEGYVNYGEGVFVGYRYYDTFDVPVTYPFGYGLSYANFTIDECRVESNGSRNVTVHARVTNVSNVAGAQTVQVYVAPPQSSNVQRPRHELKGFRKVYLKPQESKEITIHLDERAFAYWSELLNDWHVEGGIYTIEIATSSRDIVSNLPVEIEDDGKRVILSEESTLGQWKQDLVGGAVLREYIAEHREQYAGLAMLEKPSMDLFLNSMPLNNLGMIIGKYGKRAQMELLNLYHKALEQEQQ